MNTLYRTRLYVRGDLPLYPFQPHAVEEYGVLRERPGYCRTEQWIDNGTSMWIPYEGGPVWSQSRADGIKAAIREVEEAAATIAVVLAGLRQQLVEEETRAAPGPRVAAFIGHGESASGGRDVTPQSWAGGEPTPATCR